MPIIMRDKMTRWINRDPNSFHAILYMNNEVAAFANGQILKDKRMCGSRLAINMKYRKYSPGGLIVSAMVRYLIEQTEAGNIDVDTLDMAKAAAAATLTKSHTARSSILITTLSVIALDPSRPTVQTRISHPMANASVQKTRFRIDAYRHDPLYYWGSHR